MDKQEAIEYLLNAGTIDEAEAGALAELSEAEIASIYFSYGEE